MTLESTHPVTEISTRGDLLWNKGGRCVGLTTLPPSCAECVEILGASTTCPGLYKDGFTFLYSVR